MKVLNYKDEQVTLTEMEAKLYLAIKEDDGMEDCYCSNALELTYPTGIPMKQMRGVIASMIKKGVCYVDELVSGCGDWVILYEDVI